MHRHTKHLREPLDSPLRGDSCALHHLRARASESQSTEISRSSWIQKLENNNNKKNTQPDRRSHGGSGPSVSPAGFHRLPGPLPLPVPGLFQIPLISLSRVGAHPGLRRRCCCSSGFFFPLLPPPPASLPLPLHPWRAGRWGGRGHPGILIHSHCRNGRDVAFRRQARPSAKPPTGQQAANPGRSGGPSAPRESGQAGGRDCMERGGASLAFPHPLPAVRARAPGINTAVSSAAAAGVPDGGVRAFEGSVGSPEVEGVPAPAGGCCPLRSSVRTKGRGRRSGGRAARRGSSVARSRSRASPGLMIERAP